MKNHKTKFNYYRCKNIIAFFIITLFLFSGGCASTQVKEMAFKPGQSKVNLQKGSVFLLALRTDNQFKPNWPPEVYGIEIMNELTKEKTIIAVQSRSFKSLLKKGVHDAFEYKKESSSWEGLVSFQLTPGSYRITAVRGGCARGIGVAAGMASFDFPFDIPFQVYEQEYVYLGRIVMINRERVSEDEIPSGNNVVTRLPQKHSGFGTGTFDVKIYDNFDKDILAFKKKYPAIGNQNINKRVLPPWRKPNL